MHWIYLSPHLDDAVFSCGAVIWQQAQAGDTIEIWTLCAGDPPDARYSPFAQELHARWGATESGAPAGGEAAPGSVAHRREEDIAACRIVGAQPVHFPLPDGIYRRAGLDYFAGPTAAPPAVGEVEFLYPDRQSIFGPLHPSELALVDTLAERLSRRLAPDTRRGVPDTRLAAPLTLGGHVDHQLARRLAERLTPAPWYYADYPYAAEHLDEIEALVPPGWRRKTLPVSAPAMDAWAAGIAAHRSQISSFWPDLRAMRQALENYCIRLGGGALWFPPDD